MGSLVTYRFDGSVATITMDDGKVNAISPAMLAELYAAFDRASKDRAVVVLTGREGIFSAGFDLHVLRTGVLDAWNMVRSGFELAARVLAHDRPIVVACNGHAMAMGAFLTLAADYRLGVRGPYKYVVNEVAIGITMPRAAVEICRQRLAPAQFQRAVLLSEVFSPEAALEAGFIDRIVDLPDLAAEADRVAKDLVKLDAAAFARTKARVREASIDAVRAAIARDATELLVLGAERVVGAKVRSVFPGKKGTAG